MLLAERKWLKAQPQTPDVTHKLPTGRNYAEVWQELDTPGRRAFLIEQGMVVRARKGEEPEIFFRDVPEVTIEQVSEGRITVRTTLAE